MLCILANISNLIFNALFSEDLCFSWQYSISK